MYPVAYFSTGVRCTINGGFNQTAKALEFLYQSRLSSSRRMSKLKTILARIRRISAYARLKSVDIGLADMAIYQIWVSENLGDLLLPDAVPRTGAERLHRIQSIASEPRVPREPLGVEAHRVGPKLRRVINRPLPDSDDCVFWYEVTRD